MTLIDASSGEEKRGDVRASGCASNEADGANARARWTTRTRMTTPMALRNFDYPEALLFDCDGVLCETERDGHRVTFNKTFKEFGSTE